MQTSYHLWFFGDQIEHGHYPWRDPLQFRPESGPTVNAAIWPYGVVFWPLYHVFGLVLGWNVFVLLTFVLAGLAAFAWLRELGLPYGPALVGGLVFEISPYRALQSHGHLLGPITVLLPLALWALERGRRGNPLWLVLSAASIASIPLSGQVHLAIGAIPLYAAYALVRLPAVTRRRALYLGGVAAGIVLAVLAGLVIQRAVIEGSIASGGQPLAELGRYSAEWLDFVTRDPRHGSESYVFLGWLTPLVAIAGLYVLARTERVWLGVLLGVAAVVPIVLALGTNTPLYEPIRDVVPGLRYPRVPERLMPIACLAIAALVAFALEGLLEGELFPRLAVPAVAVIAAAVVVFGADLHFNALKATAADEGNKAYKALGGAPKSARLLELPVFLPDTHYGSVYQYYDTVARRQRPTGYSTTAPKLADVVARRLRPLNCGDWTGRPGRMLLRQRVREIAFHTGLFQNNPAVLGPAWFAWRGLVQHGYRPWVRDGAVILLDRLHGHGPTPPGPVPEPARSDAVLCAGWYGPDGDGQAMNVDHALMWAYGSAIHLVMRSYTPMDVRFSVDGKFRFARALSRPVASVALPLGKRGWHLISFDTGTLPKVNGRKEGARELAYKLS